MILCCSAENYMTISNYYFLLSTKFYLFCLVNLCIFFDTGVIAVLLSGSQGC